MSMTSLLIVAAGPLQVPAIEEARKLGLRTIAVDANPEAPGMALADQRYVVDILDPGAVLEVARHENIDGIMTLCTDAPVRTVAAVAAKLGLTALSVEAADRATDKRLMRKSLLKARVAIPGFREVDSLEQALDAAAMLRFPLALKVPCSSGSRGVFRVDSADELACRFIQARKYQVQGALLIEEWMDGPEVSVEGACFENQVHVIQVTDKVLFPGAFPVEAGHTQPSRLADGTVQQIRTTTQDAVHALALNNCAFHAELKVTSAGPKIVEIGARLGGDRIATHLTPLSTGVNLLRAAITIAIGEKPDLASDRARGSAVRYFVAPSRGIIERIIGLDRVSALPGLELLYPASERDGALGPGFVVGEICSSLDRYGHVLFSGNDATQAAERADYAASLIQFQFSQLADRCA
jgi:biotin carboxylase